MPGLVLMYGCHLFPVDMHLIFRCVGCGFFGLQDIDWLAVCIHKIVFLVYTIQVSKSVMSVENASALLVVSTCLFHALKA